MPSTSCTSCVIDTSVSIYPATTDRRQKNLQIPIDGNGSPHFQIPLDFERAGDFQFSKDLDSITVGRQMRRLVFLAVEERRGNRKQGDEKEASDLHTQRTTIHLDIPIRFDLVTVSTWLVSFIHPRGDGKRKAYLHLKSPTTSISPYASIRSLTAKLPEKATPPPDLTDPSTSIGPRNSMELSDLMLFFLFTVTTCCSCCWLFVFEDPA